MRLLDKICGSLFGISTDRVLKYTALIVVVFLWLLFVCFTLNMYLQKVTDS
jgi:hypothetical protein